MKYSSQILPIVLAVVLLSITASAQRLTLVLQQPPPNMLNVEHCWAVQVMNASAKEVVIRLQGRLTEQQEGLIVTAESTPITIAPGTRVLGYSDVQPATKRFMRRDLEAIILRTGSLPAGSYQVCVTAVDAATNQDLGASCIQQQITRQSPPQLISPPNQQRLSHGHPPVFTWQPPTPIRTQHVQYQLNIVEVIGQQSPEAAMTSNHVWFTTTTTVTTFTYLPSAPALEPGQRYAWRVTADFDDGTPTLVSQTWVFAVESSEQRVPMLHAISPVAPIGECNGVITTEIPTPIIKVSFSTTGGFSRFQLVLCDNPCGKYPEDVPPWPDPDPNDPTPPPDPHRSRTIAPPAILDRPLEGATRVARDVIGVSQELPASSTAGSQIYSIEFNLQQHLSPGAAAVYQIAGEYTDGNGTRRTVLSQPQCIRYRPIDAITRQPAETAPCPNEKACDINVETKVEPAMSGGLEPARERLRIQRDEFVPLKAVGADIDQLWWYCTPQSPCPETPSSTMTPLSGRVRFAWKIISGEGTFVEVGCLPLLTSTVGEQVIFMPPYVKMDSVALTKIELSIIDDNPTQPIDSTMKRVVEIRTERPRSDSTMYTITIISPEYSLPKPSTASAKKGTCITGGPEWSDSGNLIKPRIKLPEVPAADTLVFGELIVLKADDIRDADSVKLWCVSNCSGGTANRIFEDDVEWKWTILSGGGRFVKGNIGRHVIYETGGTEGNVVIEVEVYNPNALQVTDKPPEKARVQLVVVRPGILLDRVPLNWRPKFDTTLTITARLQVKVGKKWREALAHQCRNIEFRISDVSNEPGIAMNWDDPLRPRGDNPDLRFRQEDNPEYVPARETSKPVVPKYYRQVTSERALVGAATGSAILFCEDWGAFAILRASARGYERVDSVPGTIPLDTNDNLIADGQTLWDDNGRPARFDVDNSPAANTTIGDGFTNYEEYRGFYVRSGLHISTSITRKNLFIFDSAGYGIGHFTNSGITTLFINRNQMDTGRVVNFNWSNKRLHDGSQHGLIIAPAVFTDLTQGRAVGGPGLPAQVSVLLILNTLGAGAERNQVIAHEITHACNVFHHGETYNLPFLKTSGGCSEYTVVTPGGLTSGDQSCYMRYPWKQYFCDVDSGGKNYTATQPMPGCAVINPARQMVWTVDGVMGTTLCTTKTGTGKNAASRCGGDATFGNCQTQLRVKDY